MSNQDATTRADIEQRIAHIDHQLEMTAKEANSLKEQLSRTEGWTRNQQALRASYVEFLERIASTEGAK